MRPWVGGDTPAAQTGLIEWYRIYQHAGLVLSPFLYLLVYLVVLGAAKLVTRTTVPVWTVAGMLAPSLLPIALVYQATPYSTILIREFPRLVPLASDPFGFGWQLFDPGTAGAQKPVNMG